MTLKPLLDKVVVKACEAEEKTLGGILIPTAAKEKPEIAEVIAVGPGGLVDGKQVEMTVKPGIRFFIPNTPEVSSRLTVRKLPSSKSATFSR